MRLCCVTRLFTGETRPVSDADSRGWGSFSPWTADLQPQHELKWLSKEPSCCHLSVMNHPNSQDSESLTLNLVPNSYRSSDPIPAGLWGLPAWAEHHGWQVTEPTMCGENFYKASGSSAWLRYSRLLHFPQWDTKHWSKKKCLLWFTSQL
jgi:hypothetical protein